MAKTKIGGFNIEFSKRGNWDYMVAEAIAGHWRMTLRGDSEIFQLLKMFWDEAQGEQDEALKDAYTNYVVHYVRMNYICSSVSPDEQFTEEFVKSYNEYCDRAQQMRAVAEVETDEEILKEEKIKHKIKEKYGIQGEHGSDDSENVGNDNNLSDGDSQPLSTTES